MSIITSVIHPSVRNALDRHQHVIVPRLRLVRQLQTTYGNQLKKASWQTPPVFVLQQWINQQLSPLLRNEGIMLCDSGQAHLLWEDALASLPDSIKAEIGWDIYAADEEAVKQKFVRQAHLAWQLIHRYQLSWKYKDYRDSTMPRFFHRWGRAYQELCASHKVIDEAVALVEFNRRVYDGSLQPPPCLWAGWHEGIFPLYKRTWQLLQTSTETDLSLPVYQADHQPEYHYLSYTDEEQELIGLADRVKQWWQAHPDHSIGVVVPGIEQSWHRIRRIFNDAFDCDGLYGPQPPFDISWGETIQSHPLIGDLLRLLGLSQAPQPIKDFYDLFQSPYIRGAADEQVDRYRLREQLIGLSQYYKELSQAQLLAKQDLFKHCPQLYKGLKACWKVKDAFVAQASPHHWAEVFNNQAKALGWGAVSDWSDDEVFLGGKWSDLLDSLYSLARIMPSCSRQRALEFLTAQAQTVYQASHRRARLRILGLREVEGLLFDKLFVCRMNEHAIPRPTTNFFIPYRLGLAGGLPGYDFETGWGDEKRLVEQLLRAAKQVECSYALRVNEEEQLAHPLLRATQPKLQPRRQLHLTEAPSLITIADHQAPPVSEEEQLRSIVTLVKDQATCPFKAFAHFRLAAAPRSVFNEQINAQDRGTMLHALLKELWSELKSKQGLLDMKPGKLKQLVKQKARQVVTDHVNQQVWLNDPMTASLEERLLIELADRLLAYQQQSDHNFHIHALEKKWHLEDFSGYDFSLYIDRIDRLGEEENSLMILDYKLRSTRVTAELLMGERPDEPQLLIYSLLVKDAKALGFMAIDRYKEVTSAGVCLGNTDELSSSGKWRQVTHRELDDMQQQPRHLFTAFLRGDAQVDPKRADSCTYCPYASLCRINTY